MSPFFRLIAGGLLIASAGASPASEGEGTRDPAFLDDDRPLERVLFDFRAPESAALWRSVNDDVMGGVSVSRLDGAEGGTAVFRGVLSRENNGGFATVRSQARDLSLEAYDGIAVRLRGDGRRYKLLALRSDRRGEVHTWQAPLTAPAGAWVTQRIPFEQLVHTVMGRRIPWSGPLPPEAIRSLSLSIADGREGPFELEIDWIRAYRDRAED